VKTLFIFSNTFLDSPFLIFIKIPFLFINILSQELDVIIIIIIIIINSHIGHCTHTSESTNVKVQ